MNIFPTKVNGLLHIIVKGSYQIAQFSKFIKIMLLCIISIIFLAGCSHQRKPLVLQTDFGLRDGAVNAMKGVAYGTDEQLAIFDLTHEIPAFNVWEAGYRLYQAAPFWPKGTVFVSVVDPGVGTLRKSIVMKSQTGQYFVTPDNGTLTLIADVMGIQTVREIDESINRRPGSDSSYTFHGRDLYVYTAARLASGQISFDQVGPEMKEEIIKLNYQPPVISANEIKGNIPVLDIQYGNVWSNINDSLINKVGIRAGDKIIVKIMQDGSPRFQDTLQFVNTFGEVREKEPLAYLNSLMNFSVAINMGSFADSFQVKGGRDWNIEIKKVQSK